MTEKPTTPKPTLSLEKNTKGVSDKVQEGCGSPKETDVCHFCHNERIDLCKKGKCCVCESEAFL